METNASKQLNFHYETLPKSTVKAFEFLSTQKWLSERGWYLAGGTALALQTGHRKSVDLDFFTTTSSFKVSDLLAHFETYQGWKATFEENNTLYGELMGAKVSFIAYPFFIPKQDFLISGSIKILQPKDIAVMKIIAISQRGRKRDFFDMYYLAYHSEPLIETIRRLREQYPSVAHDYHHILKALVYFDDAENDPDPEVMFRATWKEVKKFFEKEVPMIVGKLVL